MELRIKALWQPGRHLWKAVSQSLSHYNHRTALASTPQDSSHRRGMNSTLQMETWNIKQGMALPKVKASVCVQAFEFPNSPPLCDCTMLPSKSLRSPKRPLARLGLFASLLWTLTQVPILMQVFNSKHPSKSRLHPSPLPSVYTDPRPPLLLPPQTQAPFLWYSIEIKHTFECDLWL